MALRGGGGRKRKKGKGENGIKWKRKRGGGAEIAGRYHRARDKKGGRKGRGKGPRKEGGLNLLSLSKKEKKREKKGAQGGKKALWKTPLYHLQGKEKKRRLLKKDHIDFFF